MKIYKMNNAFFVKDEMLKINGNIDNFSDFPSKFTNLCFNKKHDKRSKDGSALEHHFKMRQTNENGIEDNNVSSLELPKCEKFEKGEESGKIDLTSDNSVDKNYLQESDHEQLPMEPDVSITIGESNLEKTINHVASCINNEDCIHFQERQQKFIEKHNNTFKTSDNSSFQSLKKSVIPPVPSSLHIKKTERRKSSILKSKRKTLKNESVISNYSSFLNHPSKLNVKSNTFPSELQTHNKYHCPRNGSNSETTSGSNVRLARKVYLCSACGTYYENWNLFVHMKDEHKRYICLYCLGMFSQPDKLGLHLQTKHSVCEQFYNSLRDFYNNHKGDFYLLCCTCEKMFTEDDQFYNHTCSSATASEDSTTCSLCNLTGAHFPTCRRAFSVGYMERGTLKCHPAFGKKNVTKKKKKNVNKPANKSKGKEAVSVPSQSSINSESVQFKNENESTTGNFSEHLKDLDSPSTANIQAEIVSNDNSLDMNRVQVKNLTILNQEINKRAEKPSHSVKMPKNIEKVTSYLQSIEDSINRVVEKLYVETEDKTAVSLENENTSTVKDEILDVPDPPVSVSPVLEPANSNDNRMSPAILTEKINREETHKNEATKVETDNESTDSEKLTIALEHSTDKTVDHHENLNETECDRLEDTIQTAGLEVPFIHIVIDENIKDIKAITLMKDLVKVSWNCVYCAHAKRIAVNGKQLALHLLAEHRFTLVNDQASEEEKAYSQQQINEKLKSDLSNLEQIFFNTDTFDTSDKSFWKPNEKIYECFHCLFATYIHKELYTHNRKMHQKTVFLCIMCKSNFYNYSELLCHLCTGIYIAGQVINPDIKYRCFMCDIEPLPSSFRLMVHLRRSHNSCDICFDVSNNQSQLSTHVWKHKLSHMCYRCGIAYRNKPDITKHLFWKHGTESVVCKKCLQKKWPHVYHFCIPPNNFICEECNLSFKRAVALRVHKRVHSQDLPYSCHLCEEKFISKKLLVKHKDKHESNDEMEINVTTNTSNEEKMEVDVPKDEIVTEVEFSIIPEKEKGRDKEKKLKRKHNVTDLFDLPPVNLSESDDSDEEVKAKLIEVNALNEKSGENQGLTNGDVVNETTEPVPIVQGIWDNFQSYLVNKDLSKISDDVVKAKSAKRMEAIMLSDHDYYIVPTKSENQPSSSATLSAEEEKNSEDKSIGIDHDYCDSATKLKLENTHSLKSKQKSEKHKANGAKSSSSDSSSDSDSTCSCGSNCSCSTDSSSSSSSSSSTGSASSQSKKKNKKKLSKKKIAPEVQEKSPEPIVSVLDIQHVENLIRESDLETEETETDEDFYDFNPAREANKVLAEKRTQLVACLNNGFEQIGSSPATPTEDVSIPKKKMKSKKKRSQIRLNSSRSKSHKQKQSMLSLISYNTQDHVPDIESTANINNSLPLESSSTSILLTNRFIDEDTVYSSGESDAKRPKRKRVPLKFYGFSSEDEMEHSSLAPRRREKGVESNIVMPSPSAKPSQSSELFCVSPSPVPNNIPPHPPVTWRVENSENSTHVPKVHPIKIRTTQAGSRQSSPFFGESGNNNANVDIFKHVIRPQHSLNRLEINGNSVDQRGEKVYCFCQCPYDEVSEMIACDAADCKIEWFHFECVGIMVPPKGKWYCPDCKKKAAAEREFMPISSTEQNLS